MEDIKDLEDNLQKKITQYVVIDEGISIDRLEEAQALLGEIRNKLLRRAFQMAKEK